MSFCSCGLPNCFPCRVQREHPEALPKFQVGPFPSTTGLSPREKRIKPCVYRSERPLRTLPGCGMCRVFGCELHGECTAGVNRHGLRNCLDPESCGDYSRERASTTLVKTFDHTTIAPGRKGMRFNGSMIADGDGYILAYRDGWERCDTWTIRLDAAFAPVGEPVKLNVRTPWQRTKGVREKWRCPGVSVGREDPRLFRFRGRLHIAFIGVEPTRTNQCYARLNDDRGVDEVWQVNVPNRRAWEKNWQFFEHGDALYAVYLTHPRHVVVRVDGPNAKIAHDEPNPFPWIGGEIRGGAPPVRVGDAYWHFAHDRISQPNARDLYRTILIEFDGRPPFAPRRMVREPIQIADTCTQPHDKNYCEVIFTGSALRAGEEWLLCAGEHDRRIRLDRHSHAELDRRLG